MCCPTTCIKLILRPTERLRQFFAVLAQDRPGRVAVTQA